MTVFSLHLNITQPVSSLCIIDLLDVEQPEMVELLKQLLSQLQDRTKLDGKVK